MTTSGFSACISIMRPTELLLPMLLLCLTPIVFAGRLPTPTVTSGSPPAGSPSPTTAVMTDEVDIDLRHGIVKGYSQYISFVASPSPVTDAEQQSSDDTGGSTCSARAVVRIDLTSGPFNRARVSLDYDQRARLWTLDVADSPNADGYGSGASSAENSNAIATSEDSMAETQVFNEQMRIYGNALPGHRDASIDGGHLLKIIDGVVTRQHSRLVLDVSDERIEWRARSDRKQFIESKFLFSLSDHAGSRAGGGSAGRQARSLYVGLNRVIGSDFRSGSGLCRAVITLFADHG